MSDRYLLEPARNKPVGGIRERGMPIKRERRQGVGGGVKKDFKGRNSKEAGEREYCNSEKG